MDEPAGVTINGYQVIREVGRGGMATVYLATQESLRREVALKLLAPRLADNPEATERFLREARTAARLVHRHIVAIHDVGVSDGRPFLAMEFIPDHAGEPLRKEPAAALELCRQIALALDHAHRAGVVHRDLKPENILRRADGSWALADFGIAKVADSAERLTQEGTTIGTPHYMSPEQLQGKPVDGRADLYGLGVVLYQLLTGELPYRGTDGWSIGNQHIHGDLPKLPPSLTRYQPLIDTLLAKAPADRPKDGAAVAIIVESMQAALTPHARATQPIEFSGGFPSTPGRSRRLWIAGGLLALAAIAALWMILRDSAPAPDAASPAPAVDIAAGPVAADPFSIAVLPFRNVGGDPAREYFSDGLAETLVETLARVPDLTVIARTSSFAFKGRDTDIREIGRQLGVAHLVEGSAQQEGDKVRVVVQIVRAAGGTSIWSQRFDRKMADVFAIQDEIAAAVVAATQAKIPTDRPAPQDIGATENVAAFEALLRGNALLPGRKVPEMREALAHFERAIELDPNYARAYAAAATALGLIDNYAGLGEAESARGRAFAERAVELEPDLGEAYVARGFWAERSGDFIAAEPQYRRGVALSPGNATAQQWLGELLLYQQGDLEAAREHLQRAVHLDPLSPIVRRQYGIVLAASGRLDEARQVVDALLRDHPDFAPAHGLDASIARAERDLIDALRALDRQHALDPEARQPRASRCGLMLSFGALAEARACVNALRAKGGGANDLFGIDGWLTLAEGEPARALSIAQSTARPDPYAVIALLIENGRPDDALEKLRALTPTLFEEPLPPPTFGLGADALTAGAALVEAGRPSEAEPRLRYALKTQADLPQAGIFFYERGWSDVRVHALLGDVDAACAALDEAVSNGYFLGLATLDVERVLAKLRAAPCYETALAPARKAAAEQVAAARAAGLLTPEPAKPTSRTP